MHLSLKIKLFIINLMRSILFAFVILAAIFAQISKQAYTQAQSLTASRQDKDPDMDINPRRRFI